MDGHALLGNIAIYSSVVFDGGPRGWRRRQSPLPEKYLPGRFLAGMHADARTDVIRAVNDGASPAPWFLRIVADEEEPRVAVPLPPVDRRWARRGRWSTRTVAPIAARRKSAVP